MILNEEETNRLGQACELITQGVQFLQTGQRQLGIDACEAGLVMLRPTKGTRLPSWLLEELSPDEIKVFANQAE